MERIFALVAVALCGIRSSEALPPFDNLHRCHIARNECPNANVTFYLYTRLEVVYGICILSYSSNHSSNSARQLAARPHRLDVANNATIIAAPFVPNRPIIILLHGYTGHRDFSPNAEIRPAYLRDGEYNIISVDYQPLVPEPCYLQAVQNLPVVARCTAQLIDTIVERRRIPLNSVHVIGFSLGAQASGMISNYVRSGKLTRITGLDPAKPLFVLASEDHRLSWRDAEFVDVIHTDVLQRGILKPVGHADFYVNGGIEQPGCRVDTETSGYICGA